MITNYHNSSSGRVVFSLLLIIGVLSFWAAPAQATLMPCEGRCDSPLTDVDHVLPDGMDPDALELYRAWNVGSGHHIRAGPLRRSRRTRVALVREPSPAPRE